MPTCLLRILAAMRSARYRDFIAEGGTIEKYLTKYPEDIANTGIEPINYGEIPEDKLAVIYQHARAPECLEICRVRPGFLEVLRDFDYTLDWLRFLWQRHRNMIPFYIKNVKWSPEFSLENFIEAPEVKRSASYEEIRQAYLSR